MEGKENLCHGLGVDGVALGKQLAVVGKEAGWM